MSKIRSRNTKPEMALRKELWKLGLRYRANVRKLKGTPDVVFNKYKVVVFVDGEFWHGYDWEEKKNKIKSNSEFWINKIERNMERDLETNTYFINLGYKVLRFWEGEIKKDLAGCTLKIIAAIADRKLSCSK
jgi:DNA mismatch endonuclease (patch repair protein)